VAETSDRDVLVLAPMGLEWRAVRRALAAAGNPAPVVRCGISLSRWEPPPPPRPALITCGLAGGLRSDLLPGTVVVADSVAFEDGDRVGCDPQWVAALIAGARACGQEPVVGPMLTARRLVVGDARRAWAARGFVAAEMETALLASIGAPLASLRVIVDAPAAEVSERWTSPGRAALDPRRWREAAWLAARAPGYARLAARCVAGALIFAQRS
jgi:4-hydroxy-3-methylbut-2-enyl diphosphate reductase